MLKEELKKAKEVNAPNAGVHAIGGDGCPTLDILLFDILTAINAAEGYSRMSLEWSVASALRLALNTFRMELHRSTDFVEDHDFAELDYVFDKAGWDRHGFRRAETRPHDIKLVEFTNEDHTSWAT
jgi:hypothetical protein